jgi:outer membrane murein-binding lipoprotein Lpp
VCLAFLTVLLAGCSGSREQAAEAGREAGELASKVAELEAQLGSLREELAAVEARGGQLEQQLGLVKKEVYGRFERDSRGETPDGVMLRYLGALRARDWVRAYACLGLIPDDVDLKGYAEQMERSDDELLEYSVHGYEMMGRENAAVYVTCRVRYRSTGRVWSFEREPWSCIKENGVWKVRWLPRQ